MWTSKPVPCLIPTRGGDICASSPAWRRMDSWVRCAGRGWQGQAGRQDGLMGQVRKQELAGAGRQAGWTHGSGAQAGAGRGSQAVRMDSWVRCASRGWQGQSVSQDGLMGQVCRQGLAGAVSQSGWTHGSGAQAGAGRGRQAVRGSQGQAGAAKASYGAGRQGQADGGRCPPPLPIPPLHPPLPMLPPSTPLYPCSPPPPTPAHAPPFHPPLPMLPPSTHPCPCSPPHTPLPVLPPSTHPCPCSPPPSTPPPTRLSFKTAWRLHASSSGSCKCCSRRQ